MRRAGVIGTFSGNSFASLHPPLKQTPPISPADSQRNIPGVAQATHTENLLTSHVSIWSAVEILGHL